MALTQDQFNQVSQVFSNDGIPEYVWHSIMDMESGGNPNSHATVGEDSRGLFQINVQASPQYGGYDLYDPSTNAKIADQYFIKPAYEEALQKGYTNPGQVAQYVWRYGIKPNWAVAVRDGKAYEISKEANSIASGQGATSDLNPGQDPNNNLGNNLNKVVQGATSSISSVGDAINGIMNHPFNFVAFVGGSILTIFLIYRMATK